jgi:hypothetical protein
VAKGTLIIFSIAARLKRRSFHNRFLADWRPALIPKAKAKAKAKTKATAEVAGKVEVEKQISPLRRSR